MSHRIKNMLIGCSLSLMGLLIPLLLLEIGIRLLGLAPPPIPNPAIWEPHPLFGWWHIPNSGGTFHSDYNEFSAEVHINARGLRDREIGYDNPDGAWRILSLADSFGEALQVDLAATYHKQLEQQLTTTLDKPVEVLNAGVGGWGSDQEAVFYVAEGFRYDPEVVIVAFFVRNDVVNNFGPLEIARNGGSQQKQFFSLSPTGELIAPPLEESASADPVPQEATPSKTKPPLLDVADTLWQYSALYRYFLPYMRDVPPVVQRLGPSGILGGEGVVRAHHPAIPIPFFIYQSPPNEEFEAAWQLTEAIIKQLNMEVNQRGATLVVMLIGAPEQLYPTEWDTMLSRNPAMQSYTWDLDYPNDRLTAFLVKEHIPHLDLLPIFRARAAQADAPALHFQHDQHWTEAGHHLAAESMAAYLLEVTGE